MAASSLGCHVALYRAQLLTSRAEASLSNPSPASMSRCFALQKPYSRVPLNPLTPARVARLVPRALEGAVIAEEGESLNGGVVAFDAEEAAGNGAAAMAEDEEVWEREPEGRGVSRQIVGVLGGGQLGRMLCEAASPLGIKVAVLDPLPDAPARPVAFRHVVGSFQDMDTVREFAKKSDVVTVEIEHVNVDALQHLEDDDCIDIEPKPSTIGVIQIPDMAAAEAAGEEFSYPFMLKSRKNAYDGRGNAVVNSQEDIEQAVAAMLVCTCLRRLKTHVGYVRLYSAVAYASQLCSCVRGVAGVGSDGGKRAGRGDQELPCCRDHPPVSGGQPNSPRFEDSTYIICLLLPLSSSLPPAPELTRDNICNTVVVPAGVPPAVQQQALRVAELAIGSLAGAGVFGVELFLMDGDSVLLNEVAPRPHNSGHYSIEACHVSQYEQHLRAVLGLPLGDPSLKVGAAAMVNILGEADVSVAVLSVGWAGRWGKGSGAGGVGVLVLSAAAQQWALQHMRAVLGLHLVDPSINVGGSALLTLAVLLWATSWGRPITPLSLLLAPSPLIFLLTSLFPPPSPRFPPPDMRTKRKMGHVTVVAPNAHSLPAPSLLPLLPPPSASPSPLAPARHARQAQDGACDGGGADGAGGSEANQRHRATSHGGWAGRGRTSRLHALHYLPSYHKPWEMGRQGTGEVAIIMGSDSDLPVMKGAAQILDFFQVPFEVSAVSVLVCPGVLDGQGYLLFSRWGIPSLHTPHPFPRHHRSMVAYEKGLEGMVLEKAGPIPLCSPSLSFRNIHFPSTRNLHFPSTRNLHFPSTRNLHFPSTRDLHFPSTRDLHFPSTRNLHFPSTRDLHFPSTRDLHFPSTRDLHFPSTRNLHFPSTRNLHFPSTRDLHFPSTRDLHFPSTRNLHFPSTRNLHFPSTRNLHFPSTRNLHFPSTRNLHFPSTRLHSSLLILPPPLLAAWWHTRRT
ncbi:unnamed protein product [Closterium sp. NIES-53]